MGADPAEREVQAQPVAASRGLIRVVGVVVVALSAVAQEYGSGINFVMPHSLESYPGVEGLVPLAMLVAGIVLIPQVVLFARYSIVMPRAGATYVWLTRGHRLPLVCRHMRRDRFSGLCDRDVHR
jgi:amino acid transporter